MHFDGHGGYGEANGASDRALRDVQGHLVFEDDDARPQAISAEQLTALLTEHRIPIMVLNACQSARMDASAADPFASIAAALLEAGIRSVAAMGYNLYVSGAPQFVPASYRRLLESGEVAEATRAGRKAMLEHDSRQCVRGVHPLRDWVVPVLYQQEPVPLPVRPRLEVSTLVELPEVAAQLGDSGFIDRQDAIHRLERALLHQPAAGVLIHGMAGIGKTTLAKGFLRWLQHTAGLGGAGCAFAGVRWFAFDEVRSAEYVLNDLVALCFDANAMAAPLPQKLAAVAAVLHERPLLMIWDNFESAAGIEGTDVAPLLAEPDRQLLKDLLQRLHGGRSKVLITSRSAESWLTPQRAFRLPLAGLRGEDARTYCNAVVRDLGLEIDRGDPDSAALLEELEGHPLALRSVLLRLKEVPPKQLSEQLRLAFTGQTGDASTRRIFAALSLLDRGLPQGFASVLGLIGLHQRYVDIDHVAVMMEVTHDTAGRERLRQCFNALEHGGLLQHAGSGIYNIQHCMGSWRMRIRRRNPPCGSSSLSWPGTRTSSHPGRCTSNAAHLPCMAQASSGRCSGHPTVERPAGRSAHTSVGSLRLQLTRLRYRRAPVRDACDAPVDRSAADGGLRVPSAGPGRGRAARLCGGGALVSAFAAQVAGLASAPGVHPPSMAGDWREVSAEDAHRHLVALYLAFAAAEYGAVLATTRRWHLRALPLACCPGFHLIDAEFESIDRPWSRCSVLVGSDGVVLLDGKAATCHAINPLFLVLDSEIAATTYVQFFCAFAHGEAGPFRIVSRLEELPLSAALDPASLEMVRAALLSLRPITGNFATEGWRVFAACVLYSNGLFQATLKLLADGAVTMEDGEAIAELPVRCYDYQGPFRLLRNGQRS